MKDAKTPLKNFWARILELIADLPGWMVFLLILSIGMFMVKPLGALAELGIGVYWIIKNKTNLKLQKAKISLISIFSGCQTRSLWYENEGKKQIDRLIREKSSKGIAYCNLSDELNMPPYNQYYAISIELNEMGISTQIAKEYFYITWPLEKFAAA